MAATNKRGVFSLEKVLERQSDNHWSKIPEVFRYVNSLTVPAVSGGPAYGYLASGYTGTPYSTKVTTVDRIDYGNDTATTATKGPVPTAKSWGDAAGNTSYGYAGGGNPDGSKIDRVDYSNDTPTASPKGLLSQARYYLSGAGNADYGYWAGGAGGEYSTIDRKDYASDTTTNSVKGTLTVGKRLFSSGTGNLSYGYFGGGATGNGGPYVSTIERVDYSNDSATASPKGPLTSTRGYSLATGNSSYGYWGGSSPADPSPSLSSIDRIDYSSDTATAETKSKFSTGNFGYGAATGSADYGYFMGGSPQPSGGSNIHRLDYANDTADTVLKGNLSSVRTSTLGAFSGQAEGLSSAATSPVPATRTESEPISPALLGTNYGYLTAGQVYTGSFSPTSTIDRLDFDNDTNTAVVKGPLSRTAYNVGAVGNKPYGYVAGGGNPSASSIVDRIDYGNDTATTAVKGPLSSARRGAKGVGNLSYGYFGGGEPGPFSTVDRVDYANDTATAAPKGPMSSARRRQGSVSNLSYGYIAGGQPYVSTVDRIDFSNDTATASPKAPLSTAKRYIMGAGTNSYGYFAGGSQPNYISTIDRLDYANDTAAMVPAGPLWETQWAYGGGTGNASYAYFGGGYDSADPISHTARLDYANDTATALSKGKLSSARMNLDAVSSRGNGQSSPTSKTVDKGADGYISQSTSGNSTYPYGYIVGGDPTTTYVDRIDYGNDTATASPKGNLTQQRYNYNQSVASPSKGYVMGGYTPSVPEPNGNLSSIDRIDLSNDTATAPSVANLNASPGIYAAATTSNNDYAYLAGGGQHPGPTFSTIRRFDYSSDTSNTVDKSTLSGSKNFITGTGNLSFGYFGGYAPTTTIERLDYASDTTQAAVKGPLTLSLRLRASTGNQSYGYFSGGQNPSPAIPDGYNDSTIERIDYSNDTATASPKGPMSSARYLHAATGSGRYGYHVGGRIGSSPGSTSDRLDFANDTDASSPKGNMTRAARSWSGLSSQEDGKQSFTSGFIPRIRWVDSVSEGTPITQGPAFGYFYGSNPQTSSVDKLDFSNDTADLTHTGNSTYTAFASAGTSSKDYGYWTGGWSGSAESVINRVDYSNDTGTATPKGNLSVERRYHMAVGNLSAGYYVGGYASSGGQTSVEKIDYSNDSGTSSPGAKSTLMTSGSAGAGNKSYGYYAGGFGNPVNPLGSSYIERIDYSSDTSNGVSKGELSAAKYYMAGASNSNYAWYAGGNVGAGGGSNRISNVERIDFSNDTATGTPKGNLNAARDTLGGTGSSSYGYFGGNNVSPNGSTTDRIDYSNDTATATPKGNFSVSQRKAVAAVSSQENANPTPAPTIAAPVQPPFPYPEQLYNPATSKQHGYWACGVNRDPAPSTICFSSVDRLDFSNDTTAASPKGNASFATSALQSVGNASYGYITGGYTDHPPSGRQSSINRLDYANDTAALTVTGSTPSDVNPEGIYLGWGVGNASYGYWGGNYPGSSRIFRLDYSNDTSAPIITGKYFNGSYADAAGNQSYGWIAGKSPSGSRVERLDYSNDSNNTVTKGPLTSNRYDGGAASNSSYGWFGGGKNGSPGFSTVDRIDFSNDTPTASPKGNLANAVALIAATGDPNYGYFGGSGPAFSAKSYIQRIEYANDTATASPKGPLSVPRSASTAFSAAANAMP